MTRIVTTHYRYKPPPKKRKAVALEVPAVVTAKRSRHPPRGKQAAAEVTGCPNPGAAPPEHIAAINDYEKPVIVTSISRKQQKHLSAGWSAAGPADDPKPAHRPDEQTPAATSTSDALMKAMARMLRPPNRTR